MDPLAAAVVGLERAFHSQNSFADEDRLQSILGYDTGSQLLVELMRTVRTFSTPVSKGVHDGSPCGKQSHAAPTIFRTNPLVDWLRTTSGNARVADFSRSPPGCA
jgi:hypothetical protein